MQSAQHLGWSIQGRIRELEEIRAELAEKELVLLGKQQELLERDQTLAVLREEVRGCRHLVQVGTVSDECSLATSLPPLPSSGLGRTAPKPSLPAVSEACTAGLLLKVRWLSARWARSWSWRRSCALC